MKAATHATGLRCPGFNTKLTNTYLDVTRARVSPPAGPLAAGAPDGDGGRQYDKIV